MEKKPKNKKLFLIIPIALVLIAGAVFAFLYFPAQKAYRGALTAARELPYDEACGTLKDAIRKLDGNPLFTNKQSELTVLLGDLVCDHTYETAMDQSGEFPYAEASAILKDAIAALEGKPGYEAHCDALRLQLFEMTKAELEYAIDEGETAYALELMQTLPEEQAAPFYDMIFAKAEAVAADGDKLRAIGILEPLGAYGDAQERIEALRGQLRFEEAAAVFTGNNYDESVAALLALGTEQGDSAAAALEAERAARIRSIRESASGTISAGAWHTAWLDNGNVRIRGDARFQEPDALADQVFSGLGSVFGLSGGKVVTFGETFGSADEIAALENVTDMGVGLTHALFLRDDGTVAGVGSKALGRLNVSDWTDIADVAAGAWHSVGCKQDGTVLALGDDSFGQCDVQGWNNVLSVSAGLWHTVGLCADGTVYACGDNSFGQCDVSGWSDVISVACGANFTLGLRSDGTVLAVGDNAAGQCDVQHWTDVAAISAGAYHAVAVRLDGTLLAAGCIPHDALPETPIIASDWPDEPIETISPSASVERIAYVEGTDRDFGPWLYLDPNGAVLICIDDSLARPLFRVDMLATKNALPGGRVTDPEASGNVILMPTEMVESQAQKAHAVVAITGDYIGFTSNRKAVMMRNGIVYYNRAETTTMAIMPDGTIACFQRGETSAEALIGQGVKDSFSFGPVLVKDGKSQINEYSPDIDSITMRVALGYSDPYHYVAIVTLRDRVLQYSHPMTANVLVGYGVKTAYNLDGGFSSCLAFMGRELALVSPSGEEHHTIRSLSDIIMFLENDSVQPPVEEPEPTGEPTEAPAP